MAHFALLWKARAIEKYRINYEKEKMSSILQQNKEIPSRSLYEKWWYCRYNMRKRLSKAFQRCFPEGSRLADFVTHSRTNQTVPNLVWKSVVGFVGGIVLTYLIFMFLVFQLAISLLHATIMSSVIGVLLTLGLAFSYRARCLVFLLVPQFFSRVGRYTLTCYALVLILTGPATNTLKNSEVLSESMACSQEQLKTSVRQISESADKPFDSMKDTIELMMDRLRQISLTMKQTLLRVHTLGMKIANVFQNSFSWLNSVVGVCNKKLGSPYERCNKAIEDGVKDCKAKLGSSTSWSCEPSEIGRAVCESYKTLGFICDGVDYLKGTLVQKIQRNFQGYAERVKAMLFISVQVRQSYTVCSNCSRSASQGIVTEIRSKADPMLTWISWSSCVTSAFLTAIIFRAKHYQSMFETRSRFDNRYVTKELRDMDLKRMRQGRETILPLNAREKAKYVTTTSFRLVASEKMHLTRSAVFTTITTFKLLIHMVADYSLYWVLVTIRYHGRMLTPLKPDPAEDIIKVVGDGALAAILRAIVNALSVSLNTPMPDPITCLPNPHPPDFQRYAQIGVLILLLWFFALLEPYGLRLRHKIMSLYSPARAKARAGWLYNHILRTRGSFLKYARRKLRRVYKYSGDETLTFRYWVDTHIPFSCLRYLLGNRPKYPQCVLCGIKDRNDSNLELIRCDTPNCPGLYCSVCFNDIRQLCTICLSPVDYGDLSDVSLEKGSSEESSDGDSDDELINESPRRTTDRTISPTLEADDSDSSTPVYLNTKRSMWLSTRRTKDMKPESTALLDDLNNQNPENTQSMLQRELNKVIKKSLFQTTDTTATKIDLRPYTDSKSNKKNITFKICNNPMIYTALVSYDNPTQLIKKGVCENRAKIVQALNDLSGKSRVCNHTSFWTKYNMKGESRPRERKMNFHSLHFTGKRRKRIRPSSDLTAFVSSFYSIQRKGLQISIAKICATSKIGKIIRRKFKIMRRRRATRKRQSNSSYQTVFSRNSSYSKMTDSKTNSNMQENDSHELTEIIINSPKEEQTGRADSTRSNNTPNNEHSSTKTDTQSRNDDKSRNKSSDHFNKNFLKLLATFFNLANNAPLVVNKANNYKRRKKDKQSISESEPTRSDLQSGFLGNSDCTSTIVDGKKTVEQVQIDQSTSGDHVETESESDHFMTPASNNKKQRFKESILSVKNYCSNFGNGRKSIKKSDSEENYTVEKPAVRPTFIQNMELSWMSKEGKPFYDGEVGVSYETSPRGKKSDPPNENTHSESASSTRTYTVHSSTDTLTRSTDTNDTIKYEDAPRVDLGSIRMVRNKEKHHRNSQDSQSIETGTLTPNLSTETDGWWSPMSDEHTAIVKRGEIERKSFGHYQRATPKQNSRNNGRNVKARKADAKLVSFRSKPDIIPFRQTTTKNPSTVDYMLQPNRCSICSAANTWYNKIVNTESNPLHPESIDTETSQSVESEMSNRTNVTLKRFDWKAA